MLFVKYRAYERITDDEELEAFSSGVHDLLCHLRLCCLQPFEDLKEKLASVHTIIAAPALVSSEIIKELQLMYSISIVHVGVSPNKKRKHTKKRATQIAFSFRHAVVQHFREAAWQTKAIFSRGGAYI